MTQQGGLNASELADREDEDLGGAGGSSGGGTSAGRGEPSGGAIGGSGGTSGGVPGDMLGGETPFGAGTGSLSGLDGGGIAAEAAALGTADGSLADAASDREPGAERLSGGPTSAEAIGQGARRGETGSGTPGDTGDLGGGGGGTGPSGTASPGGESRA
jgi:hypothetical protein